MDTPPGGNRYMRLITIIIRPERLPQVKDALFRIGVTGITLTRVEGHGGETGKADGADGESTTTAEFHPKVKIEMAVSAPFVDAAVRAVMSAARTGEVGDGKIFIQTIDKVIRIRTGEENIDALTPVTAEDVQLRAQVQAFT